jgi:hypothetical protein
MVTYLKNNTAGIAQLVEQRTENPRVTSSSLVPGNYIFLSFIIIKTGVEGFEPPNGGTKTRSLTTWRHPKLIHF